MLSNRTVLGFDKKPLDIQTCFSDNVIMLESLPVTKFHRLIGLLLLFFFSSSVLLVCTEEYSYAADCSYCNEENVSNANAGANESQDTHDECLCPCHVSFIEPSFYSLSSYLNIQSSVPKLSTLIIKDISINIFRPPKTIL